MGNDIDIPDFKLDKVGDKRERRKGGIPWFPSFGRAGHGALATGGKGAAGAILGSKFGILAVIASVAGGAWSYGNLYAPDYARYKDSKTPKVAVGQEREKARYDAKEVANLPGSAGSASGLNMAKGSLGYEARERAAKEAAEAAAAEKLEASEDVDAPEVPEADESDAAADADAAGAADAAGQAPRASLSGGRIGSMSSGLSGGGGMSGGIGKSFVPLTQRSNVKQGQLTGARASATAGRTAAKRASVRSGTARSLARRQLSKAHRLGRASRMGSDENRSENATAAFENNPGSGIALTGGGMAAGEGGEGDADTTPNGSTSGQPSGGGGPVTEGDDVTPVTCGTGTVLRDGVCVSDGVSKDPTDFIMGLVKFLSWALVGLLALQMLCNAWPWLKGVMGSWVAWAIGITSGALMLSGIILMGMGRSVTGAVATATGAFGLAYAIWGIADGGGTVSSFWAWSAGVIAAGGAATVGGTSSGKLAEWDSYDKNDWD